MPKTTNTVPYTNARREGRTNPGLIEIIAPTDPRAQRPALVPNRADRRARGERVAIATGTRRIETPRWKRRMLSRLEGAA